MGKNVYAAPRKAPVGKRVETNRDKIFAGDQQSKKERLQQLAAQYKQNNHRDKVE